MNLPKLAILALLLSPALAVAEEPAASSPLVVPGIMTPAGEKFANLCSDSAFAEAEDPVARHNRCERLLANWRFEATRRTGTLADADNSKPGFLSLRSISRYHPSR